MSSATATSDNAGPSLHRSLGVRWSLPVVDGDGVVVEMDMRDDLRGPAGSLEGGIVSTLVDVAAGSAAAMACGQLVATEHLAVSFLAPGREGPIRASAEMLRLGKADAVCEVRVVDVGKESRLMAVGLATLRILLDRPANESPGATAGSPPP